MVLPTFFTAFVFFLWEFINLDYFTWIGTFAVMFALFLGALRLVPKPRAK